jgi:quercetin dioxygenase-like cupin family protein
MTTLQMSDEVSISRAEDRSRFLWAGGTVWDVVLGAEQTGGHVALLDQRGRHGDATPMHRHPAESEIFYVLDGTIRAFHGGTSVDLGAGSAIYLPAGQEHGMGVVSEQARIVTILTPGSFSRFVQAAGTPFSGDEPAQWEFDVSRLMHAAAEHGIEVTGPPPAVRAGAVAASRLAFGAWSSPCPRPGRTGCAVPSSTSTGATSRCSTGRSTRRSSPRCCPPAPSRTCSMA